MLKNKERAEGMELRLRTIDPSFKRIISYRNTLNDTAGMWLRTSCQHEEFRLSNNEFTIALCLRYGLKIPIIRETEKCPICKMKVTNGPNQGTFCGVDGFGHHFISGCRTDVKTMDLVKNPCLMRFMVRCVVPCTKYQNMPWSNLYKSLSTFFINPTLISKRD